MKKTYGQIFPKTFLEAEQNLAFFRYLHNIPFIKSFNGILLDKITQ